MLPTRAKYTQTYISPPRFPSLVSSSSPGLVLLLFLFILSGQRLCFRCFSVVDFLAPFTHSKGLLARAASRIVFNLRYL